MKKFLICTTLLLSNLTYAQGLIFDSVKTLPSFLELQVVSNAMGPSLRHVQENPLTMVQTEFAQNISGFQNYAFQKLAKSQKITCDGKFSFKKGPHGEQIIFIQSLNVCLDEQGYVFAHSVGSKLNPTQVQTAAINLQKEKQAKLDKEKAESEKNQKHDHGDRQSGKESGGESQSGTIPGRAVDGAN